MNIFKKRAALQEEKDNLERILNSVIRTLEMQEVVVVILLALLIGSAAYIIKQKFL